VEINMPDNVTAPAIGLAFATDELAGVHWPYAKLAFGVDGAAVVVADSAGARLPVQIGGTLPAFAATPTVALDAPTLAALENTIVTIGGTLPAGTNNIGDVDVLTVPAVASTTRAYDFAAGQRLTTSGAGAQRSTAVTAAEVLLHASVRGFIRVGDSGVNAAVAAGSIPLAADEKFHLRISSGQFISFIRDGATDGSLSIVPVSA